MTELHYPIRLRTLSCTCLASLASMCWARNYLHSSDEGALLLYIMSPKNKRIASVSSSEIPFLAAPGFLPSSPRRIPTITWYIPSQPPSAPPLGHSWLLYFSAFCYSSGSCMSGFRCCIVKLGTSICRGYKGVPIFTINVGTRVPTFT